MPRPVRVRMAPSPTGFVHLGNVRTALFNLLFARSQGGVFVLRIDDTDLERHQPDAEQAIYDGFRWIGIEWDEGPDRGGPHAPYRQSERLDLYKEHAARLLKAGTAYRCFCTPEELAAERRQADADRRPYVYSRRCLKDPPRGRPEFTVRFQVPGRTVTFRDLVLGDVSFESSLIGDFIIIKSDGYPTYNFASPVDDALMEISHVIRAQEHLSNTPGQVMLLQALGYPLPEGFAHLPMVLGQDRAKLSKRKHPEMRLMLFKEQGYLPEALLNYLALLGWNPGTEQEIFTFEELVRAFDLSRVQKGGAVWDWDKLNWVDGQYIRSLGDEELARRLEPYLPEMPPATVARAAPALKERMVKLADARGLLEYLWVEPEPPGLEPDAARPVRAALEGLRQAAWEPASVEAALERVREKLGVSRNQLYKPLRMAVTGRAISPPIQHTLALLPKEEALRRLERALG
ncbi:MAG TPA: glutamate--tRNA ligase [Candidatus Acidoferrales bacterium]|nr:glutamate--tRNA ligase [Candidatus Acidoferrales bacterium]